MDDIPAEENRADDEGIIRRSAEALFPHFDAVHIFASRTLADGRTVSCDFGVGNWFARYGQLIDFLATCDENTRVGLRMGNGEGS